MGRIPEVHCSITARWCFPFQCHALKIEQITVDVANGGLILIVSTGNRAVESFLALVLWDKAAQEHVILTWHVGYH